MLGELASGLGVDRRAKIATRQTRRGLGLTPSPMSAEQLLIPVEDILPVRCRADPVLCYQHPRNLLKRHTSRWNVNPTGWGGLDGWPASSPTASNEDDRVWILDVDGAPLVIDAFSDPNASDDVRAELRQIVESIQIEP